MHELLAARADEWGLLFYVLLALGMSVEGELLLFAAAFAAWNGLLDPWHLALAAGTGIFIGTVGWYALGAWLGHGTRFAPVRWAMRATRRFTDRLAARPARTLFLSSFVYGLYRPTQLRAGMDGMGVGRYLRYAVPTALAWIALVVALAWIATMTVLPVLQYVRYFEVALLVGVALFLAFQGALGAAVRGFVPEAVRRRTRRGPSAKLEE